MNKKTNEELQALVSRATAGDKNGGSGHGI